jgi:hypothetical protein
MNADDTQLVVAHTSSGGGACKEGSKGSGRGRIQHCDQRVLFAVYEAKSKASRPSLAYCSDDGSGKEPAGEPSRQVGFDPVEAGSLRIARYIEPFALLVGQVANEGSGSPELAHRVVRRVERLIEGGVAGVVEILPIAISPGEVQRTASGGEVNWLSELPIERAPAVDLSQLDLA